jgi:histidinol-phosphatase
VTADPGDLELALRLAAVADRITVAAFRRVDLHVETKPDDTPVTEADRGVELALREELTRARPDDVVLGEEFGGADQSAAGRRWIIDPIDGTKSFVRGIPVWATLIALEVEGALTIGVVSAPALGRRWWAGRGLGAFAGPTPDPTGATGTPIRVSGVRDLGDAQMSGGGLFDWGDHGGVERPLALARRVGRDRHLGDFWSHVLVAEGACDIGLDPIVSLWDVAAVYPIVEEAGGRVTTVAGDTRPDGGSAISTNGLLHDATLQILQGKDVHS